MQSDLASPPPAPLKRGRKRGSLVHGKCKTCGTVELCTGTGGHFRCTACKALGINPSLGARCNWNGKDEAGLVVGAMVRSGFLPRATECKCADCGKPAVEYEHRDYNLPAAVVPICRACNLRRGPAIPKAGSLRRIVDCGGAPYALKSNARRMFDAMGIRLDCLEGMPAKLKNEHWRQLVDATEAKASA